MKRGSIDWSKYDKYLGVWTDNKLAKEIGCSTKTIHYKDRAEYSMSRAGKYAFDFIDKKLNIKE